MWIAKFFWIYILYYWMWDVFCSPSWASRRVSQIKPKLTFPMCIFVLWNHNELRAVPLAKISSRERQLWWGKLRGNTEKSACMQEAMVSPSENQVLSESMNEWTFGMWDDHEAHPAWVEWQNNPSSPIAMCSRLANEAAIRAVGERNVARVNHSYMRQSPHMPWWSWILRSWPNSLHTKRES